jgi:Methylamine utilisation protein MauE
MGNDIVEAIRPILAALFCAAALTKMLSWAAWQTTLDDLNVSKKLSVSLASLVPAVEFGVSMALLISPAIYIGALVGLLLVSGFSGVTVIAMERGVHVHCNCFGSLLPMPVGHATLLRNAAIAACLDLVAVHHDVMPSITSWTGWGDVSLRPEHVALLSALCAPIAAALTSVVRRQYSSKSAKARLGHAPMRTPLPIGVSAPFVRVRTTSGAEIALSSLRQRGVAVILLFVHQDCTTCRMMLPDVAGWQRDCGTSVTLAVVASGDETTGDYLAHYGLRDVVFQHGRDAMDAHKISGLPAALLITADGRIGSDPAVGPAPIGDLIHRAIHGTALA